MSDIWICGATVSLLFWLHLVSQFFNIVPKEILSALSYSFADGK